MSPIPVEELLQEVSPEEPAGPNLEYDAAYLAVERIAAGKPERQMGDQILPAEDPDWRRLKDETESLLKRTKDLRLCLYLTVATMKTEGMIGLRDGLKVFQGVVEKFWDHLHPQLDPDDDNDPTERINIIDALGQPPNLDDPMSLQQRLLEVHLCDSRQVGRFGLRDIQIANGEMSMAVDPEHPPADLATIEAAFMDSDLEALTAAAEAVGESIEAVKAIETLVTEKVGVGNGVDLSGLVKGLNAIQSAMSTYLAKRGASVPGVDEGQLGGEGDEASDGGGQGPSLSGEVRSRQDVLNALDKITRYYEIQEPSSPVPVILKRVRKLVTMNFMEIITDLAPDAMTQIQTISGVDSETSDG